MTFRIFFLFLRLFSSNIASVARKNHCFSIGVGEGEGEVTFLSANR